MDDERLKAWSNKITAQVLSLKIMSTVEVEAIIGGQLRLLRKEILASVLSNEEKTRASLIKAIDDLGVERDKVGALGQMRTREEERQYIKYGTEIRRLQAELAHHKRVYRKARVYLYGKEWCQVFVDTANKVLQESQFAAIKQLTDEVQQSLPFKESATWE